MPYWLRREAWWTLRRMILPLILCAGIALTQFFDDTSLRDRMFGPDGPRDLQVAEIEVVDGDTIRLHDEPRSIRLVGFNTPEIYSARCNREAQLGYQATLRLPELLQNASSIEMESVRCACPPLTQGSSSCNYGRSCGILRVDGRDVGDVLITKELAVRYVCGRFGCPPPPVSWCSG
jgi:endonuclease YncB( thermonuclease family)